MVVYKNVSYACNPQGNVLIIIQLIHYEIRGIIQNVYFFVGGGAQNLYLLIICNIRAY